MPIDLLIVEGNLDSEILAAFLQGSPTVRRGGSKNALKPQARYEREHNDVTAGYLRDRDFDYDPLDDSNVAIIDSTYNQSTLGWRWARHEIENYLLDPAIVENAIGVKVQDWSELIVNVALRIRWYQIARWTVGEVRRSLPPHYHLYTKPAKLNELQLPGVTNEATSREWCLTSIRDFASRVEESMADDNVEAIIDNRSTVLSKDCLSDASQALIWCSGKDLLAGLSAEALKQAGIRNPGELRITLRDWVLENIEEAIGIFPEWQSLREQVRA